MSTSAPAVLADNERFDEVETWPADRLAAYQLDRVREVVARCAEIPGLYQERWRKAGVGVEHLRTLDDLADFPVVSKADLVAAGNRPQASRAGFSTRGTSGEPLVVWLDPGELEAYLAPTMRGFWWAGLRRGDTAMLLSPAWHRLAAMEGHAALRFGARPAYFWGTLDLPHVDDFLRLAVTARPNFLSTTAPFLLAVLRRLAESQGRTPNVFEALRGISVVGMPLTPGLRAFMAEFTGAAVFERGGTQEGAALDACGAGGPPHVHADVCHLEVVDELGAGVPDGEPGRLLVTKLVSSGSPAIRYDTGDMAVRSTDQCSCGRTLPRVRILGRADSRVAVAGRLIMAWDIRSCVESNPDLVGRLVLPVRDPHNQSDLLTVAVEGEAIRTHQLEAHLAEQLGVGAVRVIWLGAVRMRWGFRQVIDISEL